MATSYISTSLSTNSQIPLDSKTYFKTLADLSDLGASDNRAFKYYENMIVQCIENDKEYIWREWNSLNEPGLLPQAFEYPPNSIVDGIDYSNRFFNFFEYQLFTDSQINRLKDSVYLPIVQSISVSPTTFEKGLATNLVFTWNVDKKDDTLNTCTVDSINKLSEATGINRTYNVNGQVSTKTVFLFTNATRNDVSGGGFSNSNSATSTHLVPQYRGKTADAEPLYTYVGLSAYSKILSSSNAFTFTDTYVNQYAFIISRSNSLTIKDVSDFTLTIGDWASVSAFFIKKEVTVFLSDGTTETMYIYRTRETINATATFKTS